jgi:transcriptional regulator with XRE-family HTH domain
MEVAKHQSVPDFAERLRKALKERDVTQLVQEIGVSRSSFHKWLAGKFEPSLAKLEAIAAISNVSLDWLIANRGPMNRDAVPEGYALVTRYDEQDSKFEGVDYLAVKIEWLRTLPGSPEPRSLLLARAVGDAMSPTIEDGDLVLINIDDNETRDGVWALLSLSGPRNLVVRRIRSEADGKFRVLCDNPAYQGGPLTGPHGKKGRVIWSGGTIP